MVLGPCRQKKSRGLLAATYRSFGKRSEVLRRKSLQRDEVFDRVDDCLFLAFPAVLVDVGRVPHLVGEAAGSADAAADASHPLDEVGIGPAVLHHREGPLALFEPRAGNAFDHKGVVPFLEGFLDGLGKAAGERCRERCILVN